MSAKPGVATVAIIATQDNCGIGFWRINRVVSSPQDDGRGQLIGAVIITVVGNPPKFTRIGAARGPIESSAIIVAVHSRSKRYGNIGQR